MSQKLLSLVRSTPKLEPHFASRSHFRCASADRSIIDLRRHLSAPNDATLVEPTSGSTVLPSFSFSQIGEEAFLDTASKEYREVYTRTTSLYSSYHSICASIKASRSERAIQRHKKQGKLLVWERIRGLIDPGSEVVELGTIAGHDMDYGDIPGAGSVVGLAKIHSTPCIIAANDATLKGGTIFPMTLKKQLRAQEISQLLALPAVYLTDSGGAFLPLQADIFPDQDHGGRVFYNESVMGAEGIPQISIVCGSCTAGAAYIPALADDNIMVHRIGTLFLGGPPLVKAATGEVVDAETLGGATVHCSSSGVGDYFAATESDALSYCRDAVLATNFSRWQSGANDILATPSQPAHSPAELDGLLVEGREGDAFYQLVARLLDGSRFMEFRLRYSNGTKCGFGFLDGTLIGMVASTSQKPIDAKGCEKASQFLQMCDQRGTPVIYFHLGSRGPEAHDYHAAKSLAQFMHISATLTVPTITVYIGPNCEGPLSLALGGRPFGPAFTFAWPAAKVGQAQQDAPFPSHHTSVEAASNLLIDDVIRPRDTRHVLERAVSYVKGASQRRIGLQQEYARVDRGVIRM